MTRVSELARAVKSYAHEGQPGTLDVDVNDSIHTTLVILKTKFRERDPPGKALCRDAAEAALRLLRVEPGVDEPAGQCD